MEIDFIMNSDKVLSRKNFPKIANNENLNIISSNKNFKSIKKLDLRGIDQQKCENFPQKSSNPIVQSKSDIERENFAERQISKDLEKYIEFLSKEDELCDKLLTLQTPYYFLGINSKQSLSTNGKEMVDRHSKATEDFLSRIEKKLEKELPNATNQNFNLSSSLGCLSLFSNQKNQCGNNSYKKRKFNK